MAFKRQLLLCPRPRDLLLISYNHLDSVRTFVEDTPNVLNQVDETQRRIIEVRDKCITSVVLRSHFCKTTTQVP